MARTTTTRHRYPENLWRTALVLRTIGLGLGIALLVLTISLSSSPGGGRTSPITYVAVIWSIILNAFDWICLLARGRIPPGALLSLDLIALALLVGGAINLGIVDFGGDGGVRANGGGDVTAQKWVQGILIAVHGFLLGYGCLDCNMWLNGRAHQEDVRVRRSEGSRSRSRRRGGSQRGTYRVTETVQVSVKK